MPTDGTDVKVLNNLPSFLLSDCITLLLLIYIEQSSAFLRVCFICKFLEKQKHSFVRVFGTGVHSRARLCSCRSS